MKKISITNTQLKLLTSITTAKNSPQKFALRAAIILGYCKSGNKKAVAASCSVGRQAVYLWLERWEAARDELEHLELEYQAGRLSDSLYRRVLETILWDAPRPGHPMTFTENEKQQIIALASEKPETVGVPITHWTYKLLRDAIIDKGIVPTISPSQVGRFLKQSHTQTS